jgi:hypothetical protein
MDAVYLAIAAAFWLAMVALARGCNALQQRGGRS